MPFEITQLIFSAITLGILITILIGNIKCYQKMGEQWWAAIIPIYNIWVFLKHTLGSGLFIFTLFIPIVNVIVSIFASYKFFRYFGNGVIMSIIAILFSPIAVIICGFGSSEWDENR